VKLARLTLRVEDPADGALSIVLLPEGARSWYVRTHASHRSYRADLGLTLPSGEFRRLASSNVVVAPRVGPSSARAARRVGYTRAHELAPLSRDAAGSPPAATPAGAARLAARPPAVAYIDAAAGPAQEASALPERGGASDVFRPAGSSDPPSR
jgi:hypothetical protein